MNTIIDGDNMKITLELAHRMDETISFASAQRQKKSFLAWHIQTDSKLYLPISHLYSEHRAFVFWFIMNSKCTRMCLSFVAHTHTQ